LERIHRNEQKLSELGLLQPISSFKANYNNEEGPPIKPLAKKLPKPVALAVDKGSVPPTDKPPSTSLSPRGFELQTSKKAQKQPNHSSASDLPPDRKESASEQSGSSQRMPTNNSLSPSTPADSSNAFRPYQAKQESAFANASNDEEDTAASDLCTSNSVQRQEKTSAPALPDDNQERTTEQQTTSPYLRRKRVRTDRPSPSIDAGGKASCTNEKQQDSVSEEEEEQAAERIGNESSEMLLRSINKPDPEPSSISQDVQKQKKTPAPALPDDNQERTTEQQRTSPYSRRKRIPTDRFSPLAGGKASRTHEKQQDLSSASKDVEYAAENTEPKETKTGLVHNRGRESLTYTKDELSPTDAQRTIEQTSPYSRRKRIPTDFVSPTTLAGGKTSHSYEKRHVASSAQKKKTMRQRLLAQKLANC